MIILGIETSCDETAASICKDGKILTNIVEFEIFFNDLDENCNAESYYPKGFATIKSFFIISSK